MQRSYGPRSVSSSGPDAWWARGAVEDNVADQDFPAGDEHDQEVARATSRVPGPPVGCAPDLLRLWQQRQADGRLPPLPGWVERLVKVRNDRAESVSPVSCHATHCMLPQLPHAAILT